MCRTITNSKSGQQITTKCSDADAAERLPRRQRIASIVSSKRWNDNSRLRCWQQCWVSWPAPLVGYLKNDRLWFLIHVHRRNEMRGTLRIIEADCTWVLTIKLDGEWHTVCSYQSKQEATQAAEKYLAAGQDCNIEQNIG